MGWKLLVTLRSDDGSRGHRFFVREPGADECYVADNSGMTPEHTDDGALRLDPTRDIICEGSMFRFPLTKNGAGDGYWTSDCANEKNAAGVAFIVARFNMAVVGADYLGTLVRTDVWKRVAALRAQPEVMMRWLIEHTGLGARG
jgi:hypothetical protein